MSRHDAILRAVERIATRGIKLSYSADMQAALQDIRLIAEELRRGEIRTWTTGQLLEEATKHTGREHRNNGRRYLVAFLESLPTDVED